jgi:hypothetical protein
MDKIILLTTRSKDRIELERKRLRDELDAFAEETRRYEQRKKALHRQIKDNAYLQDLATLGHSAWYHLSEDVKWTKETILTAFSSGNVPEKMKEDMWYTEAPDDVRFDRDILLARLHFCYDDQCENIFASAYRSYRGQRSEEFHLPAAYRNDKEVVCTLVRNCPKILEQNVLARDLLDDPDVFEAFLKSKGEWCYLYEDLKFYFMKFSEGIRNNYKLMLKAAKFTKRVFFCLGRCLLEDPNFVLLLLKQTACKTPPSDALRMFRRLPSNLTAMLLEPIWNAMVCASSMSIYRCAATRS